MKENNGNVWTLEALKEHYDALIKLQNDDFNQLLKERDERMVQRYNSMELAVNKAEVATEKRFEGVNEFRAQLGDQSRTLMPRIETEVLIKNINDKIETSNKSINDKITALTTKIEKTENVKAGGSAMVAYIIAGISLIITVITLLAKFGVIK